MRGYLTTFHKSLLNYVQHVLYVPRATCALVPHVFNALRALVLYVLFCFTCLTCLMPQWSCPLRASCPTKSLPQRPLALCVPRILHAFVPYVLLFLRALVPYIPRALFSLVPHMTCALCVLKPPVPCVSRALCPICLHPF